MQAGGLQGRKLAEQKAGRAESWQGRKPAAVGAAFSAEWGVWKKGEDGQSGNGHGKAKGIGLQREISRPDEGQGCGGIAGPGAADRVQQGTDGDPQGNRAHKGSGREHGGGQGCGAYSGKYGIEALAEGYWVQAYDDFFAPNVNSNVVVFLEHGDRKFSVLKS